VKIQLGKKPAEMSAEELRARIAPYEQVLVDIGTGDGSYVYRFARDDPSSFAIGVDPVAENLAATSSKTLRKPGKGGLPNALFVVASIEQMPRELDGIATLVTANYPWGSLLAGLTRPDPEVLRAFAAVAARPASFAVLLNASIYRDPAYCERQGFPLLDLERLKAGYLEAGLAISSIERTAGEPPHHTRWGSRLVRGSARETLIIEGSL
jgi:16S rRNA (adenine(1408)-N(1))-methyltransferase